MLISSALYGARFGGCGQQAVLSASIFLSTVPLFWGGGSCSRSRKGDAEEALRILSAGVPKQWHPTASNTLQGLNFCGYQTLLPFVCFFIVGVCEYFLKSNFNF